MIYKIQIPQNQRREFECAECRRLLAAGAVSRDDQVEFYRGETKCLSGTVGWFADRTVDESGTPVFRKARPEQRLASPAAEDERPVSDRHRIL